MVAGAGTLVGSAVAAVLHALLSREALASWGWRLPFLSGALVAFVGLWMVRRRGGAVPAWWLAVHPCSAGSDPEVVEAHHCPALCPFGGRLPEIHRV
jgi:MFS family permease